MPNMLPCKNLCPFYSLCLKNTSLRVAELYTLFKFLLKFYLIAEIFPDIWEWIPVLQDLKLTPFGRQKENRKYLIRYLHLKVSVDLE